MVGRAHDDGIGWTKASGIGGGSVKKVIGSSGAFA